LIPIRGDESDAAKEIEGQGRELGSDPDSGLPVIIKRGPYGYYIQRGHAGNGEEKPKRITVPRGTDPESLDLGTAVALLGLPRTVGDHPETGEPITAGIGRFGPYLRTGDLYVSLRGDDDVLSVGLNRAVDLIARSAKKRTPGKSVGEHPADGKPILLKAGRYGPYLEHGKVRATVPKDLDPDALSLEQAVEVLAAKAGGGAAKTKAKAAKPAAGRGKAGAEAPATGAGAAQKSARGAAKTGAKTPAVPKAKQKVPQA
jgi:DNA topoisomerase-1